jgi:hypothetical protein
MRDSVLFPLLILLFHILLLPSFSPSFSSSSQANAQSTILLKEDMITYHKQSSFIKEFEIPINIKELGPKGITTYREGNAWFYHGTNKSSAIIKLNPQNENFTQYKVGGNTVVDNAVINLAGGQLVFDNSSNILWFTDARTNSIGKLNISNGRVELVNVLMCAITR